MITVATAALAASTLSAVAPPVTVSAQPRHIIYVHGRIVQDQQSPRPRHPKFGYYELDKILDAFRDQGFTVSADLRPSQEPFSEATDRVVAQVRRLLASGVPPDHITVVGASLGGYIAVFAAARLQNPDVRFGVLGACLSVAARKAREDGGKAPAGRILAIRDASDDLTTPCPAWQSDGRERPRAVLREIAVDTGLAHGFLYRPLPEWVNPVLEWAREP
jgi:hypothetical protein